MEQSKLPKPSGLRPPQIKTSKPLAEVKLNRMLSNIGTTSLRPNHPRRSKSVADLHTVERVNIKTHLLPKKTAKVQTASQTSKAAPQRRAEKCSEEVKYTAVKRKAEKTSEEVKPKVIKQGKIPDWDYKSRYNQLLEKYKIVNGEYKEASSKLEELEDLETKYITVQKEYSKLDIMHKTLLKSTQVQTTEIRHLSSKVSELEVNLNTQTEENTELKQGYEDIINQDKIKSEKIEKMLEQIEYLNEDLQKHNQLKIQHEKLLHDFAMLKADYDKVHSHNETLSRDLNAEIKTNKKLTYEIVCLQQDLYSGEVLRRQLHNQVQDLKGNIRVFCRVRPPVGSEESDRLQCLINYLDEKSFEIRKSRESVSTTGGKPTDFKAEFSFDRVFEPDSSQEEIFEDLSQLVQSALDGYDICVFAYGQTGSGKTYTMQGGESQDKAGMIPRTVDLIFSSIRNLRKAGWTYEVKASFLEIYNETVRDLLNPYTQNLEIRFNEGKGTMVTNLTIQSINTADELKKWMQEAQRNRAVAATDFNEHSSRSHAVTRIYLHGLNKQSLVTCTGSVNLVDLAGSESTKTSASERVLETKNIDRSLSTLGVVMLALDIKKKRIPYRNSKLTYVLQSSLGGNSKILLVVNISPFEECYAESISSLQFATKVKEVKMTIK